MSGGLFSLEGKQVFITGASSGLGEHFLRLCAREGATDLVVCARRVERLNALKAELEASHPACRITAVSMDASSVSSIVAAFDAAEKATGTAPDVLVNNAGIAMPSPVLRMDEHSWDSLMDVNLKGAFFVAKEACVRMIKHDKGGSIVNIASILGLSPGVSQANYGASKAALLHLTKTLAVEVSRNGIRCNALSPGYFETEIEWRVFPL